MKHFRWLTALVVGVFLLASSAYAQRYVEGNPTCEDVGYGSLLDVRIEDEDGLGNGTFYDFFTLSNVDVEGGTFDWSSTAPVYAVIVKGGPGANVYDYDPAAFEGFGLSTPINPSNNKPYGISHIDFCYDEPVVPFDLAVDKTADGEYDRTITWELDKTVDPASHEGEPGDEFTSDWTVEVTKTVVEDEFFVSGTITILNPGPIDVEVDVSDTLSDDTSAVVDCGLKPWIVPAATAAGDGKLVCTYTASPDDASADENTVDVTPIDAPSYVGGATATVDIDWVVSIIGDEEVTLTDSEFPLDQLLTDGFDITYPGEFECPTNLSLYEDGLYEFSVTNYANLDGKNTALEAEATVDVICNLKPGEPSKDADGSYDREFEWTLDKTVFPASHEGEPGDTFTSDWTVEVTKSETVDGYMVEGTIKIENPASVAQTFTVTDELDDGTEATVDCGDGTNVITIAAGGSGTCEYVAYPDDADAFDNTVTISALGNPDQTFTAEIDWTENVIGDEAVTLTDSEFPLDELLTGGFDITYPGEFECPTDLFEYVNGLYEFSVTNFAYLDGENTELEADATVTIVCRAPVFQGETAWAANADAPLELRYNLRGGNWATYVEYKGEAKTTALFAGRTLRAGTVEFSAPVDGRVIITVTLGTFDGVEWFFDPFAMENLMVQDYATKPSGNPAPGLFDHKAFCAYEDGYCSIDVPVNNFYGVHVNVGYWK